MKLPAPLTLKLFSTTLCLLSFMLSSAQTNPELDRKNGFLDYIDNALENKAINKEFQEEQQLPL